MNDRLNVALIRPFNPNDYYEPSYPCIGLSYLYSFLLSNGFSVMAIDAKFDKIPLDLLISSLKHFNPSLICYTAMTPEINYVSNVAAIIKKEFPNSISIIGGAHATTTISEILEEFPVFDIAVFGEGEYTLNEICDALADNVNYENQSISQEEYINFLSRLKEIKGISFRNNEKIVVTPERQPTMDLDSLPFPNYDYIKRNITIYPVFSSRGCPNKCIFCCRILGDKIRLRSPQNVIQEIKSAIKKYSPKIIDFADETFTVPKSRTIEICNLILHEGINEHIQWTAQSRVSGVNLELFKKMKESGCIHIDFGIESGNPKILQNIKKGITLEETENAIKFGKSAGLKTGCYFIIGHPFETVSTIKDTINFASKLNCDEVSFGIMVPYPGTIIYQMAKGGEGNYILLSTNWKDYDKQIGQSLELKDLDRKQLELWQRKAYISFYLNNHRYIDLFRLIIIQHKLVTAMLRKQLF